MLNRFLNFKIKDDVKKFLEVEKSTQHKWGSETTDSNIFDLDYQIQTLKSVGLLKPG